MTYSRISVGRATRRCRRCHSIHARDGIAARPVMVIHFGGGVGAAGEAFYLLARLWLHLLERHHLGADLFRPAPARRRAVMRQAVVLALVVGQAADGARLDGAAPGAL
jgi:hypothetical protein